MERKFKFSEGEYYHIYNRGVDKRDLFLDEADRKRFQRSLCIANGNKPVVYKLVQGRPLELIDRGEKIVAIGAYCLMPNHFHLLLKEISEGGISTFMEKLGTGYSMYFNLKYKRTGALFQGKFKAQHVSFDEYLKYLYAYIHLNPVKIVDQGWEKRKLEDKENAKKFLTAYPYSSYMDHVGNKREDSVILSPEHFPDYFSKIGDFETYLEDWMTPPDA